MQKYTIHQYPVSYILNSVQSNEIAIPEMQRPFVWDSIKVRDLMDSLYQGFPVGYIIAWKNPNVRLKDGTLSSGKKILIDGQQRVTALTAGILGEKVLNRDYKEIRIVIAFNPVTQEFKTATPATEKDPHWINDISSIMKSETVAVRIVDRYMEKNPECEKYLIADNIEKLLRMKERQLGFIELAEDLDIEVVTEIFVRINSKGVVLSQTDFAMSKIASSGEYGSILRKCIDYFCHTAIEPEFYKKISEVDTHFIKSEFFQKISWLKDYNEDLYDPDYSDVLRVAFTKEFERGKISDLVNLLSGRNFETRTFEEQIATDSFEKLKRGVLGFINETNFKRFVMIVKSTGIISSSLINSKSSLNFAYIVYLKLKEQSYNDPEIEKYTKRWLLMSVLTGRYSASAESRYDEDIKQISKNGIENYLGQIEEIELSQAFWDIGLPKELNKSMVSNPYLNVFFASQIRSNDLGFLSTDITVRDLIMQRGDIHHIFPKDYLKKAGKGKSEYNQIANFVWTQSEINIRVANKSPNEYMKSIIEDIDNGKSKLVGIQTMQQLQDNFAQSCIPMEMVDMKVEDYERFLELRRKLMAKKIEGYYKSL